MASINKVKKEFTHGGAIARKITLAQELERSVMSCMLWEDEFYEDGASVSKRIMELCHKVSVVEVARIAIKAKQEMGLRHVPLLLTVELAKTKEGKALLKTVIPQVIVRPDDITEFLAIYWKDGKKPLAKQVKRHLGAAFEKFDEYQLAKYSGGNKAVKLKDAMKILRPKPKTDHASVLWGKLIQDTLQTPDTWEVAISATKDKKAEWTRLAKEGRLGGMATLRNIRNMNEAGVDKSTIIEAIKQVHAGRLLPINFVASAKHNPKFETQIEEKFLQCLANKPKLKGKTVLIVDTSGSMGAELSSKSQLTRYEVAGALAAIVREVAEEPVIYFTAGNDGARKHATMEVPARQGFALSSMVTSNEVRRQIGGGGIFLTQCLDFIFTKEKEADRIIVITDEQDCDFGKSTVNANTFGKENYLINVASAKNGIGYGKWTHIDGWSDKVIDYIIANENNSNQ